MIRKTIALIMSALFAVSVCGCSSSGSISTFTIPVSEMPECFDPQSATSESELTVITNIFDGLFEKQDGEIVNNLATDCQISSDGTRYEITIKTDSVFHCKTDKEKLYDGTAVTADDFVFALQRVIDPKTKSPYADDFMNIKGAQAVQNGGDISQLRVYAEGNDKIIIELESPDYNFKEKLCLPAAYPCNQEFFESTKGAYGLTVENILSNGPYRLNYLDDESATIIENDDADTDIDRIRLTLVGDENQRDEFGDGNTSCYFSYSSDSASDSNAAYISFESDITSLSFNLTNTTLANEKIRQALSYYAYGFENSGANMDAVTPAHSVFPATITLSGQYLSDTISESEPSYMKKNSKTILTEGLTETGLTKLPGLTLLIPSDSIYEPVFEYINQLWQQNLGRYFKIEYLTSSEIKQRVSDGDYDIAFLTESPDSDSVYSILDLYTGYCEELSRVVSQAKSMSDQSKAANLIAQAEKIILDGAYTTPVGAETTYFVYKNYFDNIIVDPFTKVINLKYAAAK